MGLAKADLPLSDEGPQWQDCANTGHSPDALRARKFDPFLPSQLAPMKGARRLKVDSAKSVASILVYGWSSGRFKRSRVTRRAVFLAVKGCFVDPTAS
jgi:hypothetical protein